MRDCGNEYEFITAVRDAINSGNGLGPRILAVGIADGSGPMAAGVARVDTPEQARHWVDRYHEAGFQQMKIYSSVKLEDLKAGAAEAHEGPRQGGWGAEIAAMLSDTLSDYRAAPVKRVASPNTPIPFSPAMENYYRPDAERILAAVREVVGATEGAVDLSANEASVSRLLGALSDYTVALNLSLQEIALAGSGRSRAFAAFNSP